LAEIATDPSARRSFAARAIARAARRWWLPFP